MKFFNYLIPVVVVAAPLVPAVCGVESAKIAAIESNAAIETFYELIGVDDIWTAAVYVSDSGNAAVKLNSESAAHTNCSFVTQSECAIANGLPGGIVV